MTLPNAYFCDPRDAYCCGFFLPNVHVSSFKNPKELAAISVNNCITSRRVRYTDVAIGAYKALGRSSDIQLTVI